MRAFRFEFSGVDLWNMPCSTFDFFTGDDPTQCVSILLLDLCELMMSPHVQWHGQVSVCVATHANYSPTTTCDSCHFSYTDRVTAVAKNLSFVMDDDKVIMKGDDYSWLDAGVDRNRFVHMQDRVSRTYVHGTNLYSVRISSQKQYNTGELE